MTDDEFRNLPKELESRLNLIIQTIPRFWERKPYRHFTNQGYAYSERVYQQKLAQLAQELPDQHRLSADEKFIVSAASWLYETGMQSPNLRPILDFDLRPGQTPTFEQLQEIRAKKHLLTERLIIDSVRPDYKGPPLELGLTSAADEYTNAIAEVCRWCCDEPLERVPDQIPVNNLPVRVRLLVALLRLADQLYIDSSRVDLDLLEGSNLAPREKARWWAYHYTQTLPIVNRKIPFYYFIPLTQKEYLGHIRTLIETEFERTNNSVVSYLWDRFNLTVVPNPEVDVKYDQAPGFKREMGPEITAFLRAEVRPIDRIPSGVPREPEVRQEGLVVLDYESFLLQMGEEGYFFTPDQLGRHLVTLIKEANIPGEFDRVESVAIGHWGRQDLADAERMLRARVYKLIAVRPEVQVAQCIRQELLQRLQSEKRPKRIILVAPRPELTEVAQEVIERNVACSAWISNIDEAYVFHTVVSRPRSLSEVLQLRGARVPDPVEMRAARAACILRLDDATVNSRSGFTSDDLLTVLSMAERVRDQAAWWRLYLIYHGVLAAERSGTGFVFHLRPDHPLVLQVREVRQAVITAVQALAPQGQEIDQDPLTAKIKQFGLLQTEIAPVIFLELLKDEQIVRRRVHAETPGSLPTWQLNMTHWAVIELNHDSHLARFVLALDHLLVREKRQFLPEHKIAEELGPYVGDGIIARVYELAQGANLINCREAEDKRGPRGQPVINVSINLTNEKAHQILRNRDLILSVLYRRSRDNSLEREALLRELNAIRSFSLDRESFALWLEMLRRDGLTKITEDPKDSHRVRVELAFTPLGRLLLGRMHIYALITNLRILRATDAASKQPRERVVESLKRFVTHGDEKLARWILEYGEAIKAVKPESEECVYLDLNHSFVRRLYDNRGGETCRTLVRLVKDLARDNEIAEDILLQKMEDHVQFGYSRDENEFWIDQAVQKRRVLEKRLDQSGPRRRYWIKVAR